MNIERLYAERGSIHFRVHTKRKCFDIRWSRTGLAHADWNHRKRGYDYVRVGRLPRIAVIPLPQRSLMEELLDVAD